MKSTGYGKQNIKWFYPVAGILTGLAILIGGAAVWGTLVDKGTVSIDQMAYVRYLLLMIAGVLAVAIGGKGTQQLWWIGLSVLAGLSLLVSLLVYDGDLLQSLLGCAAMIASGVLIHIFAQKSGVQTHHRFWRSR